MLEELFNTNYNPVISNSFFIINCDYAVFSMMYFMCQTKTNNSVIDFDKQI